MWVLGGSQFLKKVAFGIATRHEGRNLGEEWGGRLRSSPLALLLWLLFFGHSSRSTLFFHHQLPGFQSVCFCFPDISFARVGGWPGM